MRCMTWHSDSHHHHALDRKHQARITLTILYSVLVALIFSLSRFFSGLIPCLLNSCRTLTLCNVIPREQLAMGEVAPHRPCKSDLQEHPHACRRNNRRARARTHTHTLAHAHTHSHTHTNTPARARIMHTLPCGREHGEGNGQERKLGKAGNLRAA